MTPLQLSLIQRLADGRFHSGQTLGEHLGVSRASVWSALKPLNDFGLEIQAVSGKGYRLSHSLELLDEQIILSAVDSGERRLLGRFDICSVIDSSSAYLMRHLPTGGAELCLAEYQQAGRGRRGRHWVSPFAASLYLSMRWRFADGMARLSGLSLACAVAIRRALADVGIDNVALKWPNDVYWGGRKLAGILLEVTGESSGPCHVVVGVGLNLSMPRTAGDAIDQPWVDVAAIRRDVGRNYLAGRVITHLIRALEQFSRAGLSVFMMEWGEADLVNGHPVVLLLPDEKLHGIGRGIADDGSLLIEVRGELRRYSYGEISLRLAN